MSSGRWKLALALAFGAVSTLNALAGDPVPTAACPDGKCLATAQPAHPPCGSFLDKCGRWLFYRPLPTPKECKPHPTPYRPPLYTWFPPCKAAPCLVHPLVVEGLKTAPGQNLLPEPPVPMGGGVTEGPDKSPVPGSSAAMALPGPEKPIKPAARPQR